MAATTAAFYLLIDLKIKNVKSKIKN